MKLKFWKIINFRKNSKIPGLFDLEINQLNELRKYSSFECNIVLYPYNRKITKEDYSFNPFEEYVNDLAKNQKSAYQAIKTNAKELFGIFLGLVIFFSVLKFRKDFLISVESIVGIFGAYFIGKDLWDDIENFLITISKNWRIRYQDNYYSYKLDKNSTLAMYSLFAKRQRYGKNALLPEKMEFIEQHNSSTARLYFSKRILRGCDDNAHLFSISVKPSALADFEKDGYFLGTKISLNKSFLCFESGLDLFQSLSKGKKGCLDNKGNWLENAVYYRKTFSISRIRIFYKKGFIKNRQIID